MRRHLTHLLLPSWWLLTALGCSSQQPNSTTASTRRQPMFTPEKRNLFDRFIDNLRKCRNLPGLTVSLVNADHDVYAAGYGVRDLKTRQPVTNKTVFCIGSLTKGFTTTILAMLVSENKSLTWDTPVREILGDNFQMSDEHRTNYVNIRDLLAHKTGIPGYFGALSTGLYVSIEQIVRRLRYFQPYKKFHSTYIYNNYMYILAGYITEVITGKSWKTLVRERILRPLGMTSTVFSDDITDWSQHALPYVSIKGKLTQLDTDLLKFLGPAGPAGTICSNAVDMEKWLRFQLNGGVDLEGRRLVAEAEFAELHTPQIPTPMPLGWKLLKPPVFPISEGRFAYDLGWGSGIYRGFHNVQHSGRVFGFDSLVWLFPDNMVAIFSSVNGPMNQQSKTALRVIHHFAADLLLAQDVWLNMSSSCTFPDPWLHDYNKKKHKQKVHKNRIHSPKSPNNSSGQKRIHHWRHSLRHTKRHLFPNVLNRRRPLSDYVGTYGHPAFGNVSIYLNESTKQLYMTHGKFGRGVLAPTEKLNNFLMKFEGVLQYISEADGWGISYPVVFNVEKNRIISLYGNFIEKTVPPLFSRGASWPEISAFRPFPSSRHSCRNGQTNLRCELVHIFGLTFLAMFNVIGNIHSCG